MNEEWVTITDASERLQEEHIRVGRNTISRLSKRGVIQTKDNPLDTRVKLINFHELRALFKEYGNKTRSARSEVDEEEGAELDELVLEEDVRENKE